MRTKIIVCAAVLAAIMAAAAAWAIGRPDEPAAKTSPVAVRRTSRPVLPSIVESPTSETVTPAIVYPPAPALERRDASGRAEARAVWVPRFSYHKPGDVRAIMATIAKANMNVVYFQVRGKGDAYYRSHFEPWAESLSGRLGKDPGWDPLAVAIEAAHANGLKVHAWVNVYTLWQGDRPPPRVKPLPIYYRRGWAVATRSRSRGRTVYRPQRLGEEEYVYAAPGNPAVASHIAKVAADIASNYDIDGLHFDRIRYPGPQYSWDAASRARFAAANAAYRRKHAGKSISRANWQRRQIDELVARIHREVKAVNPRVQTSAAAWGIYRNKWRWPSTSDGFLEYYQDSQGWTRAGTVDVLAPMTYWSVAGIPHWDKLVADFVSNRGKADIWPAVATYKFRGDWGEVVRQVRLSRKLGAQGVSFYDYDSLKGRWPRMRQLFPSKAAVPARGRPSSLSAEARPSEASVGETVTVLGTLAPMRAGAPVTLRKYAGARWDVVTSGSTDADSHYLLRFRPAAAGKYRLRVVCAGGGQLTGTISKDLIVTAR